MWAHKIPLVVAAISLCFPGVSSLWPLPRSVESGSTALKLAPGFQYEVNVKNAPSDLLAAISRSTSYLQNDKLERLVVGRGSNDSAAIQKAKSLHSLSLTLEHGAAVHDITDEARKPLGTRIEWYSLHVPSDGSQATLSANSTLGLLHGMTTFEQLWYDLNGVTYTVEAPIVIEDEPAYVRTPSLFFVSRIFTSRRLAVSRTHARYRAKFVSQHIRFEDFELRFSL